jgi:type IV secretory pathway VirB4 component
MSIPSHGLSVIALADLPEETRSPAMFLVLDRLWEHLRQREGRRRTFLVIDEAWWLVRQPDTARFVFRIAKTARKLNVGLTVITQDVLDLLASDAGKTVIANSSVQLLFKQAARAIPELAECFGLTRPEGLLLMNAPVGEGILIGRNSRTQLKVIASAAEDSVART